MINTGIEWIGEVPNNWKLERLQWHLKEVKEVNNPEQTRSILSLTNTRGVIPYEEKGAQGNNSKEDYTQYKLAYPDTIVANSMNILIGSVGKCDYFGCVSPVYYVFKAEKESSLDFINYVFQTQQFQRELRKYANGILEIRLRVSSDSILKRYVAFPSVDEQNRIVEFIKKKEQKINELISIQEKEIEKLIEYKQSLITEILLNGVNGNQIKIDSGVNWRGSIPENWKMGRIKNVLTESGERTQTGLEEPLSMSQKFGLIPTREMDLIPNMASTYTNCKIAHVGDLVFNKLKAHLGVFAVSEYEGIVSPDYAVYQAKEDVNTKYLEYLFKTRVYIEQFIKNSQGVAQGLTRLYTGAFFGIEIAIPPYEEQCEIASCIKSKLDKIDTLLKIKANKIEKLNEYKKSIIYEYVTGKKQVA